MRAFLLRQLDVRCGRWRWSPPLWALLLALAGMAFFARLGVWQWQRAVEKEQITARYVSHADAAPLPLSDVLARGADIEDQPVQLSGHYDNSRLVYLENQMRGPVAGFHVYTVFLPEGEAQAILVNRGWVPVAADMQLLPPVPPASAASVVGTVAMPSAFFTVGAPDYRQRPLRVPRLDMPHIAAALGVELRPFVIRLDPAAPDGFVREWRPADRLGMSPDKHRAYAFQWFALMTAVLVVLLVVNLRKSPT
ncbi:MAG: SURF1 family protein [Moraxellaceae bacterium]|nr:SURF1 family protein [Moraxellaceae bacterium]